MFIIEAVTEDRRNYLLMLKLEQQSRSVLASIQSGSNRVFLCQTDPVIEGKRRESTLLTMEYFKGSWARTCNTRRQ